MLLAAYGIPVMKLAANTTLGRTAPLLCSQGLRRNQFPPSTQVRTKENQCFIHTSAEFQAQDVSHLLMSAIPQVGHYAFAPPPLPPTFDLPRIAERLGTTTEEALELLELLYENEGPGSLLAYSMMMLYTLRRQQDLYRRKGEEWNVQSLETILKQYGETAGKVLDVELAYESTPRVDKKSDNVNHSRKEQISDEGLLLHSVANNAVPAKLKTQSGIVTVIYLAEGRSMSACAGFAVGGSNNLENSMADISTIVTCCHPLETMESTVNKLSLSRSHDTAMSSAALVMTSNGDLYPVTSVLSSTQSSDLLLLSVECTPLAGFKWMLTHLDCDHPIFWSGEEDEQEGNGVRSIPPLLQSLPVSPYPAPEGQCVQYPIMHDPSFNLIRNNKEDLQEDIRWENGAIVEYKSPNGKSAKPGTYDDLASMTLTSIPLHGSSGGPLIDVETGAVVGVVTGNSLSYGNRVRRGFAIPAEKIFEMFKLPGFKPKNGG